MEAIEEILPFLSIKSRLDLKAVSLSHVLGLTGSVDGIKLLIQNETLLKHLLDLTGDESESVAKDAVLCFVNITAEESGAEVVVDKVRAISFVDRLVPLAYQAVLDENGKLSDAWCMVLCNITRPEHLAEQVVTHLLAIEYSIDKLTTCFTRVNYNKQKCHLNYLGPLFSNVSQSNSGRAVFCNQTTGLLRRILPFVHHEGSIVRRGGAIGLLKNVCFDSTVHEWLLSADMDILPFVLLPLAGPEEFDDETNDRLPVDLQYLGPDKKREEDPDVRKMLVESLAQLCATRKGREYLRDHGTYEILRELHKFECTPDGDKNVLNAVENVVDILIRTEDEIGEDNLKELEIPDDVKSKIETMNDDVEK
ncbi:protein HGH1 homolog [Anopheles ziemanni]|uniref:protein HGH1 homolog n=1 Tax=Anopheles ziemanni TaxID=345580 RepID=UPI002658C5E8|nr:protein HGH1 homolog isoform X3 [Anopheles coustani]XP_058170935.1 protein HGH1 homolog [Anopheles ziemanni]